MNISVYYELEINKNLEFMRKSLLPVSTINLDMPEKEFKEECESLDNNRRGDDV